jgi:hypothetical protein
MSKEEFKYQVRNLLTISSTDPRNVYERESRIQTFFNENEDNSFLSTVEKIHLRLLVTAAIKSNPALIEAVRGLSNNKEE